MSNYQSPTPTELGADTVYWLGETLSGLRYALLDVDRITGAETLERLAETTEDIGARLGQYRDVAPEPMPTPSERVAIADSANTLERGALALAGELEHSLRSRELSEIHCVAEHGDRLAVSDTIDTEPHEIATELFRLGATLRALAALLRLCPQCESELDRDCMGDPRCSECDDSCPHCDPGAPAPDTSDSAYALSRLAECASPDSLESPGAALLGIVRDSLAEHVVWLRTEGRSEPLSDVASEISDAAMPVYTHPLWETFTDLGAYSERDAISDTADLSEPESVARAALFAIAERLCYALARQWSVPELAE